MTRTLALALLLACAFAFGAVGAAQAQNTFTSPGEVAINGSALNVFTDPTGRIGARVAGAPSSEFYPPSGDIGNAGFGIVIDPKGSSPSQFGTFNSSLPTPDSPPTLTPGNPATITTVWTLKDSSSNPLVRLTQVLALANGSRQFDARYTVLNMANGPLSFRATEAADLAIRGSDAGIGFLLPGPPRFMGGLNQDVGAAGGLVEEVPAWSAYESNGLGAVSSGIANYTGAGLDNSISGPPPIDNAAGVQWDNFYPPNALGAGQTATFSVGWRFVDTLGLSPIAAIEQTGNLHTITASVGDLNGAAKGGQTIAYSVVGANPTSGKVVTGSNGLATFSWVGGNPGFDAVTAFVDQNNNGIRDASEPQATASVTWGGPAPPVAGVTVGARTEAGTVRFMPPKNASGAMLRRLGIKAAASPKFFPLTAGMDIPVGSLIDTTRGRVRLLSSVTRLSTAFQAGSFNGSLFTVGQGTGGGLTSISMSGGNLNSCHKKLPKGGAARKRGRSLFSNVHGKFRTRGRNSSATVRGTMYLVKDTCAGTLTQVKEGTVLVRDFTLRKNKIVKAGHKYLARPPK